MSKIIEFHGWRFQSDPDRTRTAYSESTSRGALDCSCSYCRNWIAQRDKEYPTELRNFFELVGIDPHKEAEVWEAGPIEGGYFHNGGWWHFIADVEVEGESNIRLNAESFGRAREWELLFLPNQKSLKLKTLPESPIVQVEFSVQLPWVLQEPHKG